MPTSAVTGRPIINTTSQIYTMYRWLWGNLTPPVLYEEYLSARYIWFNTDQMLSDEQLEAVLACGNYWGAVIRTTYQRYVQRRGFDPKMFWNALVMVFVFGNIWIWETLFRIQRKRIKQMIARYSYPEWVQVALCGANWSKVRKMCESFCEQMEGLDDGNEHEGSDSSDWPADHQEEPPDDREKPRHRQALRPPV